MKQIIQQILCAVRGHHNWVSDDGDEDRRGQDSCACGAYQYHHVWRIYYRPNFWLEHKIRQIKKAVNWLSKLGGLTDPDCFFEI